MKIKKRKLTRGLRKLIKKFGGQIILHREYIWRATCGRAGWVADLYSCDDDILLSGNVAKSKKKAIRKLHNKIAKVAKAFVK